MNIFLSLKLIAARILLFTRENPEEMLTPPVSKDLAADVSQWMGGVSGSPRIMITNSSLETTVGKSSSLGTSLCRRLQHPKGVGDERKRCVVLWWKGVPGRRHVLHKMCTTRSRKWLGIWGRRDQCGHDLRTGTRGAWLHLPSEKAASAIHRQISPQKRKAPGPLMAPLPKDGGRSLCPLAKVPWRPAAL